MDSYTEVHDYILHRVKAAFNIIPVSELRPALIYCEFGPVEPEQKLIIDVILKFQNTLSSTSLLSTLT